MAPKMAVKIWAIRLSPAAVATSPGPPPPLITPLTYPFARKFPAGTVHPVTMRIIKERHKT